MNKDTNITDTYKIERILNSVEETFNIGKSIGALVQNTSIKLILLYGALGSGKTSFTRGFVSAFNKADLAEVSSPTFTLVNHYPTSPAIIHADIYRLAEMANFTIDDIDENTIYPALDLPEELEEALYENAENSAYTLIEWADFINSAELTKERLDIFLKIGNNNRSFSVIGYTKESQHCLSEIDKIMQNSRNN